MPLRLLPWSPEYGAGLEFDAAGGVPGDEEGGGVDLAVEGREWTPVDPAGEPPAALQIVDGVRRAEAHAMDDGPGGEPLFGLFGSFAVGLVRCDLGGDGRPALARVPADRVRVERRYFQAGGAPETRSVPAGASTLRFRAELPEGASSANDLVDALNRAMLDEEARLAEDLAGDGEVLTLVDGPLRRLRSPGAVVGYVKRIHNWYIDAASQALLRELAVGQRTPLFRITSPGGRERYSWFLRLADLGRRYHRLGEIMRLETPGVLPLPEAVVLADRSSLVLPRLASSPARDPRAPHNLTPVGALEAVLTRRLGHRLWVRRMIALALEDGALEDGATDGATAGVTAGEEGAAA